MTLPKPRDPRRSMRFEKVFRVLVEAEDMGPVSAVARNLSSGGILIETPVAFALGSIVRIHFEFPDTSGSIAVRAEVKNHYAWNYNEDGEPKCARGIGLRFHEFLDDGAERLIRSLDAPRTFH
ncbi:MAG: PilZ domain-containing protein [Myxococcales bacterium]|nr:PilZ domain-containing protein [Myxococcales bacterium]